ncbi:unnamed protein product [Lota lota]
MDGTRRGYSERCVKSQAQPEGRADGEKVAATVPGERREPRQLAGSRCGQQGATASQERRKQRNRWGEGGE